MAQIEGLQVNIVAKTDQLQKGLDEVKKGLASVATESERQAERISNPLKGAADAIEARYGNLAGTLATRLIGLINPATLAATAITVVGAGLISYYQSLQDKVVDVDAALQTHGKLIKDLKAAYGEAMSGLDQYTQQSENSLKTRIAGSLFELDQAVKQTARTITDQFGYTIYRSFKNAETGVIEFGNAFPTLPAKFAPFREAIERLQTSITNGNPDYVTFKNSVEAIGAAAVGVNQPLATTASELANLAAKGAAAQQAIAANTAALSAMDPEARKAAAALETYNSAISKLLTIAPAKVTDRYKADEAYLEAIQNAGGDENKIRQAVQARNDTLRRIEAEEALKAKPATTDNSAEKLAREQEQITKRLEMLVTGWGTEEEQLAAHLVRNQDLINQAKAKEAIDDQTHKILMLGAEEEYQKKIQRIRDITNDQALSSTANMFGSLQRLTESFGKKGTALAKAFGIAQALINTYVGVTKALSTLPPPASYAAAAATLAAGMAQVASIRSISDSGKGGGSGASASSGGGAAAAAAGGGGGGQPGGNSVYINLQGQTFGRDQVRDLVKQIADFQKDGGQVVFA